MSHRNVEEIECSNGGVEERFHSGFNWLFEQCEAAIILEDDEVPHPSFFPFCREMLERYRDDPRVFAVNGTNFIESRYRSTQSYYFSRYFHCWGFATWRPSRNTVTLSANAKISCKRCEM